MHVRRVHFEIDRYATPVTKCAPDFFDLNQCLEQNDREAMINEWSTFNSDDKGHCIAETTMGGVWSYTTWSPVWKCHAMYENCTSGQTASPSQPSGDCRRRRVIASRHDSPDRTTALHIGESDEQMETDKPRLRCRPGAILRCERFSTFSAVIKLQMGILDAGSCVPQGNQTACRSGNGQAGVGY